jgi:hypothetical protein
MSEPVVPERWQGPLDRLQRNGPYDDRFERQILEELGAAEAKVAELEREVERLNMFCEGEQNNHRQSLAQWEADNAEHEATITRLKGALEIADDKLDTAGYTPAGATRSAIRAALSKQAQP